MAERKLFSEPDEDSGLALMDREPVLLPEERKMAAQAARQKGEEARDRIKGLLE